MSKLYIPNITIFVDYMCMHNILIIFNFWKIYLFYIPFKIILIQTLQIWRFQIFSSSVKLFISYKPTKFPLSGYISDRQNNCTQVTISKNICRHNCDQFSLFIIDFLNRNCLLIIMLINSMIWVLLFDFLCNNYQARTWFSFDFWNKKRNCGFARHIRVRKNKANPQYARNMYKKLIYEKQTDIVQQFFRRQVPLIKDTDDL